MQSYEDFSIRIKVLKKKQNKQNIIELRNLLQGHELKIHFKTWKHWFSTNLCHKTAIHFKQNIVSCDGSLLKTISELPEPEIYNFYQYIHNVLILGSLKEERKNNNLF